MTKRKRKIILFLGLGILTIVILLGAFPLWFPWLAKPVLQKFDVQYGSYERDGFGRFVLHDVEFAQSNATFSANEIRAILPTTLLWRKISDGAGRDPAFKISGWNLDLLESDEPPGTNTVVSIIEELDEELAQINRWISGIQLERGEIRSGKIKIEIPVATYSRSGQLSASLSSTNIFPTTDVVAHLEPGKPKRIFIKTPEWDFQSELQIVEKPESLELHGEAVWMRNRFEIAAQFHADDLLPHSASLQSKSIRVPAEILKLEGYGELTGTIDLRWQTNQFTIDLDAAAEPLESAQEYLSSFNAVVHASGDTNSIEIETANVSSSWLQAKLSDNVAFSFQGEMLTPSANLSLAVDLSRQKWIAATGILKGSATLVRSENRFPDTTFQLSGAGVGTDKVQTERLGLHGELDWPRLRVNSAKVEFSGGGIAEGDFRYNAVAREITEGNLKVNGRIGHEFLPPDISYENVSLSARFHGPLKSISHSAHVELRSVKFPQATPLEIVTDWQGELLNFETFKATITAKNSSVRIAGSANVQTNDVSARVTELALFTNAQPILELQKPFTVFAQTGGTISNLVARLEPIQLRGGTNEIALAGNVLWPGRGTITASGTNLNVSALSEFFEDAVPEILIGRFNLSAGWTNGPVEFSVGAFARFVSEDGTPFSADVLATGNGEGIDIERARAGTEAEAVLTGKGFFPLAFEPGNRTNLVQVLPTERIDFHASTIPNAQFWEQISKWTKIAFLEPSASIAISGTLNSPEGRVLISAKEIALRSLKKDQPMPRFQNLLADFNLVRERIALNRFEVFVENQPVIATGELPLPTNFQTNWQSIFDWRKANVHLKIIDAQMAPFARLFPNILSPLGMVNLDATITNGMVHGELRVANAALRPISTLGPVHDIGAQINFLGDRVKLETFKGSIGGQPVNLSGEVNLAKRDKTTDLPMFSFKLQGKNVPLARQPELILRSDLDLVIAHEKEGEPVISGAVNLRQSFFLADLKILVPGQVAQPEQRPPYFSVEQEPFAKWRLNVAVRGDKFLQVRTPVFRGEISANFKVEGTLKEPMLLGDARIASGIVQFPFANLRVDQGFVSLTSQNLYQPQLSISASARTFGYDIRMDVSGSAGDPVVEFSSTPGLTSEQILLMVTAGELPRDEVNFSTEQKAGKLAFFLGKNILSKFGGNGATDEKLVIRSGEEISEQGRQTYYLEYKLTDDWSIVGEYDRFGGINAGFKWKFYEK